MDVVRIKRRQYKCDWNECSRSSTTADCLESHINIVRKNVRPFKCQNRDKSYGCRANLKKHFSLNHSENSVVYNCEQCDYRTKNKNNLTIHIMRHLGQKPHKYDWNRCKAAFISINGF